MMRFIVTSQDAERTDEIYADLFEDLRELNLTPFQVELQKPAATEGEHRTAKGDPVSVYAIVLALVSAGGALTVAAGKEGFLTRIASVLDSYVQRKINIKVKRLDGTEVELEGPPKNIERILSESLKRESRE